MEIKRQVKRGASYLGLSLVFLFSLYAVFTVAFEVSDGVVFSNPTNYTNISRTYTVQLNVSDFVNFSNVTFSAYVPGGSLVEINVNTTVNLTTYSFGWNTQNGNFPDNNTWILVANGTNETTATGGSFIETLIHNVTIDNNPPGILFVGDGANSSQNPTSNNYFNSTPLMIILNFTPFDNLSPILSECNVTINPTNSTFGGQVNTSSAINNGTNTRYLGVIGATYEGRNNYHVTCEDNDATINAGNATRTLIVDLSPPMANATFKNSVGTTGTQFAPSSEVTVSCSKADSISGINRTEIFIKAPFDTSFNSKKVDTKVAAFGTILGSPTEHTFPSSETSELGTYQVRCDVTDRAGNILNLNQSFDIVKQPPSSSSAYTIPGFQEPIAKTIIGVGGHSDAGELTTDGLARLMSETAIVLITINGVKHSFTVNEVGEGYVMLGVASEPFEVRINEQETKDIDVDGDNMNDITVNLNMIYKNKADLVFTLLSTPTVVPVVPGESADVGDGVGVPSTRVGDGFPWMTVLIVLVLIIVVVFGVLFFMRRRDGVSGGGGGNIKFTPKDLGMGGESEPSYGGLRPPGQRPGAGSQDGQRQFY
jgi:hypothetical protein